MTDEPANDEAPSSPVELGGNPEDLEFGCTLKGSRVVIRFNTLVQWFDMDAELAAVFGAAIIKCAREAARRVDIITPPEVLQ
jgi:hypothetical protein